MKCKSEAGRMKVENRRVKQCEWKTEKEKEQN